MVFVHRFGNQRFAIKLKSLSIYIPTCLHAMYMFILLKIFITRSHVWVKTTLRRRQSREFNPSWFDHHPSCA